MRHYFGILWNGVLDFFFPLTCIGCASPQTLLCDDCLAAIPLQNDQVCYLCKQCPTTYGQTCPQCSDKHLQSFLDGIFVAAPYNNTVLQHSIHLFKYRSIETLGPPLSSLLMRSLKQSSISLPDSIYAVPLHTLRLRWRGFNQSEVLARTICDTLLPHFTFPLGHELIRKRFTKPQMSITNKAERFANMQHAFAWQHQNTQSLAGKCVWLIDDIATTSATLEACAALLKQQGATRVFGIVLAR